MMPIRGTGRYTERCKQYFFIVVFMLFFSSCGTYNIFKTSDFGKISDLNELNGTYQNKPRISNKGWYVEMAMFFANYRELMDNIVLSDSAMREAIHEWEILYRPPKYNSGVINDVVLSESIKEQYRSFAIRRILSNIDSVMLLFPDNYTLVVSYLVNDTVYNAEFKGKKRKKYFEIYQSKKQIIIPLIYSNINVSRFRIGRYKKTNDLLIRHLNENFGNLLIIMGGEGGERPFVYKRIE